MTEDYVSFETAMLLKEKGFDEPCYSYYCDDNKRFVQSWSIHPIMNITNPCFFGSAAPTQSHAMKWLREVHKLFIEIRAGVDGSNIWYDFDIMSLEERAIKPDDTIYEFNTYEEAAEAAIKYCLENLVK